MTTDNITMKETYVYTRRIGKHNIWAFIFSQLTDILSSPQINTIIVCACMRCRHTHKKSCPYPPPSPLDGIYGFGHERPS